MVTAVLGPSSAPEGASRPARTIDLECVPSAEGRPASLLERVTRAIGMPRDGNLLRVRSQERRLQQIQSDRTYAPFFDVFLAQETWLDPATGARLARGLGGAYPGSPMPASPFPTVTSAHAQWVLRDGSPVATPDYSRAAATRPLDPWAVVSDFSRSPGTRVAGRCLFRDYLRIALERSGPFGAETLLLDAKSWVPVGLVREEPHFLWGQVRAEYVWSNWSGVEGGGLFPLTAFRSVAGEVEISRTVTSATLLPLDSAPPLTIPDTALVLPATPAAFARPERPDTTRVGPNTWLLTNRWYATTVTLQRDTVFVLDATLGEPRARQDADWIAKLFPGPHPVVLVVTDLAWPHIAGVRYWVANGATVVSHRASRDFLSRVVERRWTRGPDLLERRRDRASFRFVGVDDSLRLANGAVVLHAIDGVSSEVALMAWLPGERFLWPGDFIQDVRTPSEYAREVLRATRRVGIRPDRFAAEHVPLTSWSVIESLHPAEAPAAMRDVPDATMLRTGRLALTTVVTRNGEREVRGESVTEVTRGTYRGRPAFIVVREFDTPTGPAVDSSMADPRTLAPIRHVGVHSSRTMILDFDGARVTGSYAAAGEPVRPIDQTLPARPWDSSLFDFVIAALPLDEGYVARIPFYVWEQGGLVWYTARVTGTDSLELRDGSVAPAWTLDVEEDGELRSRMWVSRGEPREVLRVLYRPAPGIELMNTR
jgi:hypothetical protein